MNAEASVTLNSKPIGILSNVYKQGFYTFNNKAHVEVKAELLNDKITTIIYLDENLNLEFIVKMPYKQQVTLPTLNPGVTIGIAGEGDVALEFEK